MELLIRSFLLGIGLAMDACCVSMANGLKDSKMNVLKMILMAACFGLFQGLMPLLGYFVGHAFLTYIEPFIPWIALILLALIGIKMVWEGIHPPKDDKEECGKLGIKILLIQAIATSIDALSVGFTIADYRLSDALVCTGIVCGVTFLICLVAVLIGKIFGTKLGNKAEIIGGIILIAIGIEIFVSGLFF